MPVGGGDFITAADMNRALRGGPERPICILRSSVNLSIASAGTAVASWDVEDEDSNGWHDLVTNPSRITPNVAGVIRFSAQLAFGSVAGGPGRRTVRFRKNGATTYWSTVFPGAASTILYAYGAREIRMNGTTDYLELQPFQDSGSTITTSDTLNTYFSAEWIRE